MNLPFSSIGISTAAIISPIAISTVSPPVTVPLISKSDPITLVAGKTKVTSYPFAFAMTTGVNI